jgi:hypothetical protein
VGEGLGVRRPTEPTAPAPSNASARRAQGDPAKPATTGPDAPNLAPPRPAVVRVASQITEPKRTTPRRRVSRRRQPPPRRPARSRERGDRA